MPHREPDPLPIALRVYPEGKDAAEKSSGARKPQPRPDAMFVFDTETRTDATQRLTFGSYRYIEAGQCLREFLFYGDDLPDKDRRALERYKATHTAETGEEGVRNLDLLTREQLVARVYLNAYKARCLLIAFNFPFDISRIAYDFKDARRRFAGGFSLGLWSYIDNSGCEREDRYRPWISIKHIDSKRALKGFTGRKETDKEDRIPEGSPSGKPNKDYVFHGHFLDLRTLAFALTDRGYSLEQACEAFGVEHGKHRVTRHGIVTPKYIDYNRRDVLATWELAEKLLEEYDKHPIDLQVTKAYSPASIGKAYLRAMGIKPIMEHQPNFPKEYLGYAQSAFFGGRTSAHIRKVAAPVVYTDFLSMYPTVNSLMDLWSFVTAREIKLVDHCQHEIEAFLCRLAANPGDLFKRDTWKHLTAFVRIIPDGDILPTRAKYSAKSNDWQVAVNHLYAKNDDPNDALWFSLPDVAASVLLTGRVPRIVDAFRIEPHGTLRGLGPTKLRGEIRVNPRTKDFFKVVIEERQRLASRTDTSKVERERLDKALKVLANATSYGIYAEMHRQESDEKVTVTCHGIDDKPYRCRVSHPDVPGEYCFPPLASLITGAARLMLSLLEHSVRELGGTYAMEDTDSMAIVANERGGVVPCPGGQTGEQRDAVMALSWEQVGNISSRFADLNPYDRDAVPGSILKIEDDNRDPKTKKQRQLYCLAISAKRYALFLKDENSSPVLLRASCPFCGRKNRPTAVLCKKCEKPIHVNNKDDRWSEHGLGHLLNPSDPESEDREWIAQVWLSIIRRALGLQAQTPGFEHLPAVGRVTVSSPAVMRPLTSLNEGKRYCDQIKPFNFLLTCHVKTFGHPLGVDDPGRFHLIGPYESDPRQWLKRNWIDQYSGNRYRITTAGPHGTRLTARVKTYGDVLIEYEYHPEAKCADADGKPCGKQTIGLLQRRHIRIAKIKYIGKESNSLEDVESGLEQSPENVYTEYPDPRRDEWQTEILCALKTLPLPGLVKESGLSRRALLDIRAGRSRPHLKNQKCLTAIVRNSR